MRTHRRATLVAALTAALVIGVGCGLGAPGSDDGRTRGPGGLGGGQVSRQKADDAVRAALKDVERYWAASYPALTGGERFTPLRGGYHPYTRRTPAPPCGGQQPPYQPNAFYCPDDDYIAWDAEALVPQLYADYGRLLVAVVMAHEFGHAVQVRLGLAGQPTIVLEQQADCFAGGWIADVNAGRSDAFEPAKPEELDSTVAGMLTLRDQPGVSARAPEAHGNAFDRVRALQEGIEQGAGRCAKYRANNLPVTEVPFSSRDEAASGGDLPYEQAVDELSADAQDYWGRAFPRLAGRGWQPLRVVPFDPAKPPDCPGGPGGSAFYCKSRDFIAFDDRKLGPTLHQHIGDNAVGMLLADLFARAAQERRGASVEGREGQLAVDCLAGSWTYDLLHRGEGSGIRLSPGDLDEAVAALLVFGRAAQSGQATAFDRIAAFRTGTLNGLTGCG